MGRDLVRENRDSEFRSLCSVHNLLANLSRGRSQLCSTSAPHLSARLVACSPHALVAGASRCFSAAAVECGVAMTFRLHQSNRSREQRWCPPTGLQQQRQRAVGVHGGTLHSAGHGRKKDMVGKRMVLDKLQHFLFARPPRHYTPCSSSSQKIAMLGA